MTHDQIHHIAEKILNRVISSSDVLSGDDGSYGVEYDIVYEAIYDTLKENA